MRSTVHEIVDDHIRFPYTSSNADTWNILELADEDPANSSNILDVYKNASYVKIGGGTGAYNREHTWPNSYGFPDDGSSNYPYTNCHALFLSDSSYNSSRGNNPYRYCSVGCTERPTDETNGEGGGTGVYISGKLELAHGLGGDRELGDVDRPAGGCRPGADVHGCPVRGGHSRGYVSPYELV